MSTKPEQMTELQKKNVETAMRLAQMSIESSQRIMQLQVDTARSLFEESVANARSLAEVSDPKAQMELRTKIAQTTTEKMLACARQIAQISSETQSQFGKMVSEQLATGSKDFMEAMQKMFAGMPTGTAPGMGSMQDALDAARSAFEQVIKASQDAFANMTQMASQATGAAAPKASSRKKS